MGQGGWEVRLDLEVQHPSVLLRGGSAGPRGLRTLDQDCLTKGSAQHLHLLTSLAWPPQDISPEECVYTHDPTGLNVLKKGCAHYCNQTVLVSLGTGHSVPSDLGTCFSFGPPTLGLNRLPASESSAVS